MMLITNQYQDNYWPMRVALNVMMNPKWDELMTSIGLICKQIESLTNPKEDTFLRRIICRGQLNDPYLPLVRLKLLYMVTYDAD